MTLPKIAFPARRRTRLSPKTALRGLLSAEQVGAILERERARSDRTGEVFSLVVLEVGKDASGQDTLGQLATILQRRLRLTDDAGLLDSRRIGVVLPITPAAGAWTVVDDVCLCVRAGLPLPQCTVYCYPTDWPDNGVEQGNGEQLDKERPAQPMEQLFVRRLPIWKRTIDIVGAVIGLILLSPLLAAAALAVRISSKGPVLFSQWRDGLGGEPFKIHKFRSMVVDAERRQAELMAFNEQQGPVFKIRNDPRVTPMGRFLRKTSIDELPQLWNVLKGEMSLVGPRPPLHHEVCQYRPWQRHRLDVTPGLTCSWQVQGRSRIPFLEWMRMDVRYIRSRSIWQDFGLLLRTVPAVLFRTGAN